LHLLLYITVRPVVVIGRDEQNPANDSPEVFWAKTGRFRNLDNRVAQIIRRVLAHSDFWNVRAIAVTV
jgi:hypothetical protein